MPLSEGTCGRISGADLLALAQSHEPGTTSRTLEHWRAQTLLPRPTRGEQDGVRPTWWYEIGAADQLEDLMVLRRTTKNPDVLRSALWFKGYPVPTARARDSAANHLEGLQREFEVAVSKRLSKTANLEEARWQTVVSAARTLAPKRSHGVARQSRQNLADRSSGIALAIGLVLGVDTAIERIDADAPHAERLIGLDRARRFRPDGVEPWLSGPPGEGIEAFARIANIERIIELLRSSTDDELDMARVTARAMLEAIAAFSKLADALLGRSNASGMGGVASFLEDIYLGIMMPAFILSIRTDPAEARQLDQALEAISGAVAPVQAAVKEFDALPPAERAVRMTNIMAMPFQESLKARRLLEEFSQHRSSNSPLSNSSECVAQTLPRFSCE
jgi:hypothetical protein